MENEKFNLPRKSLTLILICFGVILLYVLGVIFPQSRILAHLDQEIATLKPRVLEHETLLPFFESLKKQLDDRASGADTRAALTRKACEDIYGLPAIFEENAGACGLKIVNLNQDMNSITGSDGLMKMDLYAQGDFFDFREFLLRICDLPCLERIETLGIRSIIDSDEVELQARVCLKTRPTNLPRAKGKDARMDEM